MNKELIDSAVKDLADGARTIYGEILKEVILFGSCARGDYESDSDVDVMILLDIPKEDVDIETERIHPLIHDLDIKYEYDLLFAPIIQSANEFDYWLDVMPFYQNVRNEGIRYV